MGEARGCTRADGWEGPPPGYWGASMGGWPGGRGARGSPEARPFACLRSDLDPEPCEPPGSSAWAQSCRLCPRWQAPGFAPPHRPGGCLPPAAVREIGTRSNCTFCGVFRRQALDRGATLVGAAKLATGHNADDIAETVLLNIVRGDLPRLAQRLSSQAVLLKAVLGWSCQVRSVSWQAAKHWSGD